MAGPNGGPRLGWCQSDCLLANLARPPRARARNPPHTSIGFHSRLSSVSVARGTCSYIGGGCTLLKNITTPTAFISATPCPATLLINASDATDPTSSLKSSFFSITNSQMQQLSCCYLTICYFYQLTILLLHINRNYFYLLIYIIVKLYILCT